MSKHNDRCRERMKKVLEEHLCHDPDLHIHEGCPLIDKIVDDLFGVAVEYSHYIY